MLTFILVSVCAQDYIDIKLGEIEEFADSILDEQRIRDKIGTLIFMGEPFLNKSKTFTDLFYDLVGIFSFHVWDGFLAGLYSDSKLDKISYILN